MKRTRPILLFSLLFLWWAAWQAQTATAARPSRTGVLVPFLPGQARALGRVDGALLVYNPDLGRTLQTVFLRGRVDDRVLFEQAADAVLVGDERYGEVNALVERLPHELTELARTERYFADASDATFSGPEVVDRFLDLRDRLDSLRAEYAAGAPRPFVELPFSVDLSDLFDAAAVGDTRTLTLEVGVLGDTGESWILSVPKPVTLLPPLVRSFRAEGLGSFDIHPGDLHVHSCKGEAVNACAPFEDCTAETLQTSGSFDYSQLKSQFQSLGYDWFTATDHSYCIDAASEYDLIVSETAALTDAAFICLPDIELSSDEVGAQIGSDIGDLACLGTTSANHMGAHGVSHRIDGGSSGLLGFCDGLFDDALDNFIANAAEVRGDGGYPIAHHPTGSFGWNSFDATLGIESNQIHGVEIWNGAFQSGQGGDVGQWVDWLLGGRILYAYSGSDTHDEAFAFGAVHAVLTSGSFTPDNLERTVREGRVYLSNQHLLVLEVESEGVSYLMGSIQGLAPGAPASALDVRAHYDFGADSGTISIFTGKAGDASESLLCQSGVLTGAGVFECAAVLDPTARSWYRAYSENLAADRTAYTNPVFFAAGNATYAAYGQGLGGANIGSLASASSANIGSRNVIDIAGLPQSSSAVMFFSPSQFPAGVPILGGHFLLGVPFFSAPPVPLAGGAGAFVLQIPFEPTLVGATIGFQALAPDVTQIDGVALTHAVSTTLALPGS